MTKVELVKSSLGTPYGNFSIVAAPVVGRPEEAVFGLIHGGGTEAPLVRIHSQCLTGDVFHSRRCDCGQQFTRALELISQAEYGILIYQMQEGRGIGLMNKLRAYELQDQGLDTVDANLQLGFHADPRTYDCCAALLKSLGVGVVRLLSNNPGKLLALESHNIRVAERIPLQISASPDSERYLAAKRDRMGHLLT